MKALHCDKAGCDTWRTADTIQSDEFYTLTSDHQFERHFCTLEHLMLWAARHSEPTEEMAV
jgi:hypothetical protein